MRLISARCAAVLMMLAVWSCTPGSCPVGQQSDPGGGGCIVIGGGADVEGSAEALLGDHLDERGRSVGDEAALETVFVTLSSTTALQSARSATAASALSTVSVEVVGVRFLLFEVNRSCSAGTPATAVVSPGPFAIFPDLPLGEDVLLAVQMPAGERICGAQLFWAAGTHGLFSFEAVGTFDDGQSFELRSSLAGVGAELDQVNIQIEAGLELELDIDSAAWLQELDPAQLGARSDGVVELSAIAAQPMNRAALAEIEARMPIYTHFEVRFP